MATSKTPSERQPATASTASPKARPATSRTIVPLTPSEIESLRKETVRDMQAAREQLRRMKIGRT